MQNDPKDNATTNDALKYLADRPGAIPMPLGIEIGDRVEKINGYSFPGIIVAKFKKIDPTQVRFVVECTEPAVSGMLHIFRYNQLKKVLQDE